MEPADRGQQVGPEGEVGAAAPLQHHHHLGEGLGDQVVDVRARHQLAGEASRGLHVALEELAVGVDVAAPDRRDQLGVRRALDRRHGGAHKRPNARVPQRSRTNSVITERVREKFSENRVMGVPSPRPRGGARGIEEGAPWGSSRWGRDGPRTVPRRGASCPRCSGRGCRRTSRQWGRPSPRGRALRTPVGWSGETSPGRGRRWRRCWRGWRRRPWWCVAASRTTRTPGRSRSPGRTRRSPTCTSSPARTRSRASRAWPTCGGAWRTCTGGRSAGASRSPRATPWWSSRRRCAGTRGSVSGRTT